MNAKETICKSTIAQDFNNGKKLLRDLEHSVTFFGSARTPQTDEYAILAQKLAFSLAKKGINIITGGGDGIMQAGNRGAYKANNAESVGLNIELPFEQSNNPYTTKEFNF